MLTGYGRTNLCAMDEEAQKAGQLEGGINMRCEVTFDQFVAGITECKTCKLYNVCLNAAENKYLQDEREGAQEG